MAAALTAFALAAALGGAFVWVPVLARPFTRAAAGARWRSDAVPLAGGVAMAAGCAGAVASFGRNLPGAGAVLAAAGVALAVGLIDDLHPLPAWAKLAGQAGAGTVLAALGVRAAVPIAIGYVPIAIAFGILARQAGLRHERETGNAAAQGRAFPEGDEAAYNHACPR